MGARHSNMAANHNSTHFLVWSTGPLLIFFGRPDRKLFLTSVPILPWLYWTVYLCVLVQLVLCCVAALSSDKLGIGNELKAAWC